MVDAATYGTGTRYAHDKHLSVTSPMYAGTRL
jgi:hypothetical protein